MRAVRGVKGNGTGGGGFAMPDAARRGSGGEENGFCQWNNVPPWTHDDSLHRGIAYHARQVQRCIHCRCMPTDTLVSLRAYARARLAYTLGVHGATTALQSRLTVMNDYGIWMNYSGHSFTGCCWSLSILFAVFMDALELFISFYLVTSSVMRF